MHRAGISGDHDFKDVLACANYLRGCISAKMDSNSIEPNELGISFRLNFSGIIGNSIEVPCVTTAKEVACQVKGILQSVDGFHYRCIFEVLQRVNDFD
jgi:hypothetical protein